MVKVIKDKSYKKCKCEYCDSILEYNMKDITISTLLGEKFGYITCPACGRFTNVYKKIE